MGELASQALLLNNLAIDYQCLFDVNVEYFLFKAMTSSACNQALCWVFDIQIILAVIAIMQGLRRVVLVKQFL
ncbi:hypothetical protein DC094_07105 [Pelagibaculum spongiae]|uniref:Uncharacterized protein n=1 Tax=Pelagibaculum spongiae TaxID=2080658 RepID=A0A2V1GVD0_9GAMM|nr:hypothetical protein DC094_07105 [Pelagibaculum spongiae]